MVVMVELKFTIAPPTSKLRFPANVLSSTVNEPQLATPGAFPPFPENSLFLIVASPRLWIAPAESPKFPKKDAVLHLKRAKVANSPGNSGVAVAERTMVDTERSPISDAAAPSMEGIAITQDGGVL